MSKSVICGSANLGVHRIEEFGRCVPALGDLAPVVTGIENLGSQPEPVLPSGRTRQPENSDK